MSNCLVSMYLDFAELQAINHKLMYMQDWITKLDDFLRLSEREILSHADKISHQQAFDKAHSEYDKYNALSINKPSFVEQHFIEAIFKGYLFFHNSSPFRSTGRACLAT